MWTMEFLELAGLDIYRDVPLSEIKARTDKIINAYIQAKSQLMDGQKMPKRFKDYGENLLCDSENVRVLMAFLRQAARQTNAAILCKKMGCAKDGRFTTHSTYRLLVQAQ